jgi:serine/threonine protein kinase HipA of HipAB toxin-antitoxin module
MGFNAIARNHDDHTKPHSFLMNQTGQWSLAPAADVKKEHIKQIAKTLLMSDVIIWKK